MALDRLWLAFRKAGKETAEQRWLRGQIHAAIKRAAAAYGRIFIG